MKICLVTAFPPSRRMLNEYGFHIARELQRDPLLSLTILADDLEAPGEELPDFEVRRCWDFNQLSNPVRLLKAIRDIKPDVVWFNLLFSTFGNNHNPLAAFSGLTVPALTRLTGAYTHVTLHHLMDHVNLADAGIRSPRLYKTAGYVATRMLLLSNSVSVLLPAYRRTLIDKYRGKNVHFRAHGILAANPVFPDLKTRGNPEHRVLAFGKWGTYKRLELLIEAFDRTCAAVPNARLVVAGQDHPMAPGYLESVAERFRRNDRIRFIGYVAEEDISRLFSDSSVVVLPYSSATGASGVAHLACQHGVPLISSDIPDFREMSDHEGLAIDFYQNGSAESLGAAMTQLLQSPERQREMANQNFHAALRMTMPQIIRQYLRSFERHQRVKALQTISRIRRLPSWVPSRIASFHSASPRWATWM